MQSALRLMGKRRFAPLFWVQFSGAFNDNLFRTAMVLLVIYGIYNDPTREATLSAVAGGLFILPFFLFSAFAGSLADRIDKALMIRRIKSAEILIMATGAAGLILESVPLLLLTLSATGLQSAFFGPIKYALVPQHLREGEVLGGTGIIQAGTYVGILGGTLLGGALLIEADNGELSAGGAAAGILLVAALGRLAAHHVPPAPPQGDAEMPPPDWNVLRGSVRVVRDIFTGRRARIAIFAISFFWALGAVLLAQFPPLVKNAIGADQRVATLFLAIFSIGVAVGSVAVNALLRGAVSARFAPWTALGMGAFVMLLWQRLREWTAPAELVGIAEFLALPGGSFIAIVLAGIALMGGAFVVPLYAVLMTSLDKARTARGIAVLNIVNAAFMVTGSLALTAAVQAGIGIIDTLVGVAAATVLAALLGWKLAGLGEEDRDEQEAAEPSLRK